MAGQLAIELSQVSPDSMHELRLNGFSLIEQNWRRELDGRIQRQISIGNHLQSLHRSGSVRWRTAHRNPCKLHLRESGNF